MPILILSKLVGRILAWLPEGIVETFTRVIGWGIYHLPIKRIREMKSNLHHAFPDRDAAWRARVGKATSARLVEMATFALASPFLSKRWFEGHLSIKDDVRDRLIAANSCGGGVMVMPHVTLFEMGGAAPAVLPETAGQAVVYRPLRQEALDQWVRQTRERWGMRLLSRKDGFRKMMEVVRKGGLLTLLFDQNAGKRGSRLFFFGRLASATHLPGLMVKKFDVAAYFLLPRRTGFWRIELEFDRLPEPETPGDLVLTSHERLQRYLSGSEEQAADWLWFHNRWSTQTSARNRFFLREEDSLLGKDVSDWPRRNRLWIRMPNWLGDVVMALPLIRAVREGRPDAELTLFAQASMRPLLEHVGVADRIVDLPGKDVSALSYFWTFVRMRGSHPDSVLCLTNSFRGDFEAFLCGCPQRMGMLRPGKRRPLLTNAWEVPPTVDETQCHQLEVWEQMLRSFGLRVPLGKASLGERGEGGKGIGLICGTENMPEKRWPIEHWRVLIKRLLANSDQSILLYGTKRDREITIQVAKGFDPERVKNLAGETNLADYLDHLQACHSVICNDTGGMHLANMLGVPVYAIFGPTNPIRTGPVFDAPVHVLQPRGCPATGGADIGEVTVEQVWKEWDHSRTMR